MTIQSKVNPTSERRGERGAALITMLLMSMLLLAAGGALILTSALSGTNATDSSAETQAYYAGEAGLQATLNVLRGNVAPITFRQATSTPSLAGWLTYNTTYNRVTLNNNYSPLSGMAYNVTVTDPDNTGTVIYSVAGAFPTAIPATSTTYTVGTSNQNTAFITYTPPTTNPTTISLTGTAPFGSFQITPDKPQQFNEFDLSTLSLGYLPFNLTISQTSPYPSSSSSPTVVVIACKLTGKISSTAANNTVKLEFPTLTSNTNNISNVSYARAAANYSLTYNATTAISPVTITAPQPYRLLVKVIGYGPRAAEKHLQMMVHRYAFDFKANAAITLRSADDGTSTMPTFAVGNSSQYRYSGNDNAGGAALPAFAVTNVPNNVQAAAQVAGNTQITGSSQVSTVSLADLSTMLQTAQGAREAVTMLRDRSKREYWPTGSSGELYDRYFPSGTTPDTYGTEANPLITFVDGDAALPPGGGAGLLVVTGIMDMRGNADFKGMILVLGTGQLLRNGGGNGVTLGAVFVASFGSSGNFLPPSFDSNGSGTSDVFYDSKWVEKALMIAGPSVRGLSEY